MAKSKTNTKANQPSATKPESLSVSKRGVKTGQDFANLMSSVMSDLIEEKISPQVANAVCNAGGKLLKIVEMQHKYGTTPKDAASEKVLVLATGMEAVQ